MLSGLISTYDALWANSMLSGLISGTFKSFTNPGKVASGTLKHSVSDISQKSKKKSLALAGSKCKVTLLHCFVVACPLSGLHLSSLYNPHASNVQGKEGLSHHIILRQHLSESQFHFSLQQKVKAATEGKTKR